MISYPNNYIDLFKKKQKKNTNDWINYHSIPACLEGDKNMVSEEEANSRSVEVSLYLWHHQGQFYKRSKEWWYFISVLWVQWQCRNILRTKAVNLAQWAISEKCPIPPPCPVSVAFPGMSQALNFRDLFGIWMWWTCFTWHGATLNKVLGLRPCIFSLELSYGVLHNTADVIFFF